MKKMKSSTVFLSIIFLVGILTLLPYGAYLDQTSEQRILFANIEEYMIQFGAEDSQLVHDLQDFGVLPISIDEDRDHGMAVYYPAFSVWFINQHSYYWGSVFWHVYTFLIIFWGMCSLFFLGKELFKSEKIAGFTTLMFFLTPRIFAESHYNNKDVVLASLCFTMFYWGMRLMKDKSIKSLSMLAFVGALAFNMKIIGGWTFGALGLYILIYFIVTKQMDKQLWGKTILCIVMWVVLSILLTPGCWVNMVEFFEYLFLGAVDYNLWHDWVLFDGRMVHQDYTGMPKKYLPIFMLYTIPVGILLLCAIGSIYAVVDSVRRKSKGLADAGYVVAILVIGAVPLVYAVLAATPLYNGWRHFYFVYSSLIVGLGYGAYRLWEFAKLRNWQKPVAVVSGAYVVLLAVGIAVNYPQEHSYFNILAGDNVVERYELDYWDMSVKQAFDSVIEDKDSEVASVGAFNWTTWWGVEENWKFLKESKKEQLTLTEMDNWKEAEYVIVNTSYAFMYSQEEHQYVRENYEFVADFTSYGNVICEVYKR